VSPTVVSGVSHYEEQLSLKEALKKFEEEERLESKGFRKARVF